MATQEVIKILFLAANPQDSTRLQIDEEMRAVDQALRMTTYRECFDLRSHWAVRYDDLQELLSRHQPHIVHFSGHGSQAGELIFQDNGGVHPVTAEVLSELFAILRDNLRCIVLNACYSEHQAQAIAAYIECVVGMPTVLSDASAISFSVAFYRALGYGRNVRQAFDLGCNAIKLSGLLYPDIPQLLALHGDPTQIQFVATKSNEMSSDVPNNEHNTSFVQPFNLKSIVVTGNRQIGQGNQINIKRDNVELSDNEQNGYDNQINLE